MEVYLFGKRIPVRTFEQAQSMVMTAVGLHDGDHISWHKHEKQGMIYDGKKWVGSIAYDGTMKKMHDGSLK